MNNFRIMFALLIITTVQQVRAQETKNGAKFGVKGGVNFSNLYTEDVSDENVLVGYHVGLTAKLPITDFLSIQPELLYATKGAELTYNNAFATGTAKFALNYIEIPLLAVINVNKNINIHAGPYVAFLIDGKVTNQSNVNAFNFEDNLSKDDFNRFDAGLSIGAGVDVESFSFGVRYNYGLQKVGKERSFLGNNYTYPDGKNSVINLFVGLALN
jgi:Outer membrane protein beta-barrel domain